MTREEFDIITNKIGCWFTHLKLNSFRKTFDGEVYPSSALGTDYDLFIHKLEKELSFKDKPSLPSNIDEAAEEYERNLGYYECMNQWPSVAFKAGAEWMVGQGITVECCVRVYPTLDGEPRPWVALYKNGIQTDSLRYIPELETLGFSDDDTAIVQIRKK